MLLAVLNNNKRLKLPVTIEDILNLKLPAIACVGAKFSLLTQPGNKSKTLEVNLFISLTISR